MTLEQELSPRDNRDLRHGRGEAAREGGVVPRRGTAAAATLVNTSVWIDHLRSGALLASDDREYAGAAVRQRLRASATERASVCSATTEITHG